MMSGYPGNRCLFVETYQGNFSFAETYPRPHFCTCYVAYLPSLADCHIFKKVPFYLLYQARQSAKPYTFGTPEILGREQVHSHRLDTRISPSQLSAVVAKYATTEQCEAFSNCCIFCNSSHNLILAYPDESPQFELSGISG